MVFSCQNGVQRRANLCIIVQKCAKSAFMQYTPQLYPLLRVTEFRATLREDLPRGTFFSLVARKRRTDDTVSLDFARQQSGFREGVHVICVTHMCPPSCHNSMF